jgi:hypothetical protein
MDIAFTAEAGLAGQCAVDRDGKAVRYALVVAGAGVV